jgi:hypothetical protein
LGTALPLIRLPPPSPRNDGEKFDFIDDFANRQRGEIDAGIAQANFSPFFNGEKRGRRQRSPLRADFLEAMTKIARALSIPRSLARRVDETVNQGEPKCGRSLLQHL